MAKGRSLLEFWSTSNRMLTGRNLLEYRRNAKETQLMLWLSQTNEWRAGCAERRKSGSVRGVEKRVVLWENQSWSQPVQRALLLLYQ